MFDHYSQMTDLSRKVASQHPDLQRSWQDALRENRDTDLDVRSNALSNESLFCSLAISLGARFQQWNLRLFRPRAWQVGLTKHGLALGHHQ